VLPDRCNEVFKKLMACRIADDVRNRAEMNPLCDDAGHQR
jgi:hypothetical protein